MSEQSAESAPQEERPNISIVGFAEGHLHEAPFDEPGWLHWGINRLHTIQGIKEKPWAAWFNIHDLEKFHGEDQEHLTFLKNFDGPVFLRPQDIGKYEIPNAQPFPWQQLVDKYGRYFNNTISWLLAFAIEHNPSALSITGVDMAQDSLLNAEYCVSPETRILTSDLRWVPAEQIQVGDELVAFDEYPQPGKTYREFRTTTVEAVTELLQPSYRLQLADGTKLVSSDKHRWLHGTQASWQTTAELTAPIVNDRLIQLVEIASTQGMSSRDIQKRYGIGRSTVQRILSGTIDPDKCRRDTLYKVMEPWDYDSSRGAGWLAGAFDGEGHLSMYPRSENAAGYNVGLGFAQRDNLMADDFHRHMAEREFTYGSHGNDTVKYQLAGGRKEIMRLLGSVRPSRLLDRFDANMLGVMHKAEAVEIVDKEFIGQAPVVGIQTGTGTFIAEGFASHNSHQRPSCEFFLGIAAGLGIEITLPKGSDLLKASHLYGFEDAAPWVEKNTNRLQELGQRKENLKQEMAKLNAQNEQLKAGINQLDGAMQDVQFQLRNWRPLDPGIPFQSVESSPDGTSTDID